MLETRQPIPQNLKPEHSVEEGVQGAGCEQGYLAHEKEKKLPKDHHMALDVVVLQGPRRGLFLTSELPL